MPLPCSLGECQLSAVRTIFSEPKSQRLTWIRPNFMSLEYSFSKKAYTFHSSIQLFSCSRETARFDKPRQKLLKKRFGCGAGPLKGRSRRVGSFVAVIGIGSSVICVGLSGDTKVKLWANSTSCESCPLYAKSIKYATWQESAFEPPDE